MAKIDLEGVPVVALASLVQYLRDHEEDIGRIGDAEYLDLYPIFYFLLDRHPVNIEAQRILEPDEE